MPDQFPLECPSICFNAPLVSARFRRREKRFLAEVDLADGSRMWVHVPNSGALTGCLSPGMKIILTDDAAAWPQDDPYLEILPGKRGLDFNRYLGP